MGNIVQPTSEQRAEEPYGEAEPAIRAAERGDVEALSALLYDIPHNPIAVACPKTLTTPLHVAASSGHVDAVKFLLDEAANPNKKDASGETPLHAAVAKNHVDVAGLLLAYKADITVRNNWARTPLLTAIVHHGNTAVSLLLRAGSDVNAQDDYGLSPAHIAACYGRVPLLTELVSYGADLNLQNAKGRTPLMMAINAGHKDVVEHLVDLGAQTLVSDKQGLVGNALEEACHLLHLQFTYKMHNAEALSCSVHIFHTVLAAHGHSIQPKTFVSWMDSFMRCYLPEPLFAVLLAKLALMAGVTFVHALPRLPAPPPQRQRFVSQMRRFLPEKQTVMSLQKLCLRQVRKSLLSYGENVVSASNKLDIPPALITIIQMKNM